MIFEHGYFCLISTVMEIYENPSFSKFDFNHWERENSSPLKQYPHGISTP